MDWIRGIEYTGVLMVSLLLGACGSGSGGGDGGGDNMAVNVDDSIIVDNGIVIEGYNDGGSINYGWPVAVYQDDFESQYNANTTVASNSNLVTFSNPVVSNDGVIAAFLVTVSSIANLSEGEEMQIPLWVE